VVLYGRGLINHDAVACKHEP